MAQRVYCIVTNVTSGAAFAVREDNDECVYIPAAINHTFELEDMDRIRAIIVKNTRNPSSTPWLASRVTLVDDEGEKIELEDAE